MEDPAALPDLVALRHALHRQPELSGQEAGTAAMIADWLESTGPDVLVTGLGGHGLAAVYTGALPGPTVMLRAELDALPITEAEGPVWRSEVPGCGHLCGHDGHMTILAGMAARLGAQRPARGRAVLLFQPAEEDGAGAARVIADPRFAAMTPDYAFAIHNYPGLPLGHARLAPGVMHCASRGMRLHLHGRTAHAAQPETGLSPALTLATLIPALTALSAGDDAADPGFRRATITHACLGTPAFGVAPGEAELWVTLRSHDDAGMAALVTAAEALRKAQAGDLRIALSWHDIFAATANDPEATALAQAALDALGLTQDSKELPMRASEDFGRFGQAGAKAAMILLGAGQIAALHNPDYDFPDALIAPGVALLDRITRDLLG